MSVPIDFWNRKNGQHFDQKAYRKFNSRCRGIHTNNSSLSSDFSFTNGFRSPNTSISPADSVDNSSNNIGLFSRLSTPLSSSTLHKAPNLTLIIQEKNEAIEHTGMDTSKDLLSAFQPQKTKILNIDSVDSFTPFKFFNCNDSSCQTNKKSEIDFYYPIG